MSRLPPTKQTGNIGFTAVLVGLLTAAALLVTGMVNAAISSSIVLQKSQWTCTDHRMIGPVIECSEYKRK